MKTMNSIPLQQVRFTGEVCGLFGRFSMTAAFENQTEGPVELVYTFPLPHKAAVSAFRATLGGQTVLSRILPCEEAFAEYEKALERNDSAVLVERQRPNIFTLSLGRLEADELGEIVIDYTVPVQTYGREMRIEFPTVVAPRYTPGVPTAHPTTMVPDADDITPEYAGEGYPLQLEMRLIPPGPLQGIRSPSHSVTAEAKVAGAWSISLVDAKTDRDMVIVAELASGTAAQTVVDSLEHPEYVQLTFIPELPPSKREPRDFLFLVDVSGSMDGEKLA